MSRGASWLGLALVLALPSVEGVAGAQDAEGSVDEALPVAIDSSRLRLSLPRHAWRADAAFAPWDAAMTGSAAGEIWTSGIHESRTTPDDFLPPPRGGLAGPTFAGAVGLTDDVELGARICPVLCGQERLLAGVELRETLFERATTMLGVREYFVTSGRNLVGGGLGLALRYLRRRLLVDTGLSFAARGDHGTVGGAAPENPAPWRTLIGLDVPLALTWVHPRVLLGGHVAVGLQLDGGDGSITSPIGGHGAVTLCRGRVVLEGWVSGDVLPIFAAGEIIAAYRFAAGLRLLGARG